jgi:hypothetical protein
MIGVICEAISNMRVIEFDYQGARRLVEPHTVGRDQKGHQMLCGWQLAGGSAVSWRNYHLAEMSRVQVLEESFDGPRPGYNRADKRFTSVEGQL